MSVRLSLAAGLFGAHVRGGADDSTLNSVAGGLGGCIGGIIAWVTVGRCHLRDAEVEDFDD